MNCFVCQDKIILQTNWVTVLYPEKNNRLCQLCEKELKMLKGNRCNLCSRESSLAVCSDCERWKVQLQTDPLTKNISLYTYNSFIKDVIANWKYRGDYVLGSIFAEAFRHTFDEQFKGISQDAAIIPIPLSEHRLLERGFNQAEMLASFLTTEPTDVLKRINSEKQSKKSRKARISSVNPFKLQSPINKRVVLVDDIYTTGRTVRHAASLLKDHGCPEVYAYTLIRG